MLALVVHNSQLLVIRKAKNGEESVEDARCVAMLLQVETLFELIRLLFLLCCRFRFFFLLFHSRWKALLFFNFSLSVRCGIGSISIYFIAI